MGGYSPALASAKPVKHRQGVLTLYTGQIIEFSSKSRIEYLAGLLKKVGIESKVGHGGKVNLWYLLVWRNDVDRARRALGV